MYSGVTRRWKKKPVDKCQRIAPHSRGEEILGQEGICFCRKEIAFQYMTPSVFSPPMETNANANAPHRTAPGRIYLLSGEKMKKKMTCRTCVLSFLPHSLPPLLPHSDSPALLTAQSQAEETFFPGGEPVGPIFSPGASPARPQI